VKTYIALILLGAALTACGGTASKDSNSATGGKAPDENAALETMRKVNEAQSTYFKLNRRYAIGYDELVAAHLLDGEPTAAQTGYDFKLRPTADAQTYKISVVPGGGSTAVRYFYTDQTGVIRAEAGKDATADSPEVK
jgi:hypothetical protein